MSATTTSPQVQFRVIDGVRIRYADSGGSQGRTLLLTSPWPESLYAFASMWATLAERARPFAIDLPGFGASERRDDLLSPRAMRGFLAQLIVETDLDRPHIVAPDVGTSAALFAPLVRNFARWFTWSKFAPVVRTLPRQQQPRRSEASGNRRPAR